MYTRCDGRDNTQKLCDFISIVVPQKKVFIFLGGRGTADVNQQKHTQKFKV